MADEKPKEPTLMELYANVIYLQSENTILRSALAVYFNSLDDKSMSVIYQRMWNEDFPKLVYNAALDSPYQDNYLDSILQELLRSVPPASSTDNEKG